MMTDDAIVKDKRDIKRNLRVEQGVAGVFVYAISKRKKSNGNFISVPAKLGVPIGNECYDVVKDVYYIEGIAYTDIGFIPVNYKLVDENNGWISDVPLPKNVLKRYMTKEQKSKLAEFKSNYSSSEFNIEFLQILNVF